MFRRSLVARRPDVADSAPTQFAHCIIGGGIVGLALAAKLGRHAPTLLIERHPNFITETSSRNSGVVHAGIYYPLDSLKTKLCVEGNTVLRRLLEKNVRYELEGTMCKKWIGCNSNSPTFDEQFPKILELERNMDRIGSEFTPHRYVPQREITAMEPNLTMDCVIESQHSGVIDVHSLAHFYEVRTTDPYCQEVITVKNTEVVDIQRKVNGVGSPFIITTRTTQGWGHSDNKNNTNSNAHQKTSDSSSGGADVPTGSELVPSSSSSSALNTHNYEEDDGFFQFEADVVINCAGHEAENIHRKFLETLLPAELVAESHELSRRIAPPFSLHPCKGRYVKYTGPKYKLPHRLIYPVPLSGLKGLGVHATLDVTMNDLRFGPDAMYVKDPHDLKVDPFDEDFLDSMHKSISEYMPHIKRSELMVDYAGVRPKLSAEGEGFKDFYIEKLNLDEEILKEMDRVWRLKTALHLKEEQRAAGLLGEGGCGQEEGEVELSTAEEKEKGELLITPETLLGPGELVDFVPRPADLTLRKLKPSFLAKRDTLRGQTKRENYGTFITLAGIESPGLTASPAIADYVSETLLGYKRLPWV